MASEKLRNLTVRINEETLRGIDEAASLENTDRSTITRQFLQLALKEKKKARALDQYRAGECTLWKAAQIAGVNIREMIALAEREKIPAHITTDDVDEAWSWALEARKE